MRVFKQAEDLRTAVGELLGESPWLVMDQERIDQFAAATDDHQWIHVDPDRAASGPFGATIAHGFLSLSLLPYLLGQIYCVEGPRLVVNYGLNRVRFVSPVRVRTRLRARAILLETSDVPDALQVTVSASLEIDGQERPALVAEYISRLYF